MVYGLELREHVALDGFAKAGEPPILFPKYYSLYHGIPPKKVPKVLGNPQMAAHRHLYVYVKYCKHWAYQGTIKRRHPCAIFIWEMLTVTPVPFVACSCHEDLGRCGHPKDLEHTKKHRLHRDTHSIRGLLLPPPGRNTTPLEFLLNFN